MTAGARWAAVAPRDVCALLTGLDAPWWIGGGWALDLRLGAPTRPHADVDVVVLRGDEDALGRHVAARDPQAVVRPGELEPQTAHPGHAWLARVT